jgi:hypothetical protein
MRPDTTGLIKWSLSRILVLWLLLLLYFIPGELFGGEAERTPLGPLTPNAAFVLTIDAGLLSLKAEDASFKAILEAIGQRMHIEVVAQLPADQTVTIAFDHLPLEAALKRLGRYASMAYLVRQEAGQGQAQITQITAFPKGGGPEGPSAAPGEPERVAKPEGSRPPDAVPEEPSRPKPFRLTFDPSQFPEAGK